MRRSCFIDAAVEEVSVRSGPSRDVIVVSFDNRIARHAVRMLSSLSQNNSTDHDVVILARGWRPWTEAFFRSLVLPHLRLYIFDLSSVSFSRELRLLAHTTAASMDRLFLPQLLPGVDRVVYLDVDVICLADLAPLFELDIVDSGIAAKASIKKGYSNLRELVRTWTDVASRETLLNELVSQGAPEKMRTFNSGVLVMDLEKLRQRAFVHKTLDFVTRFGVNDQLAMNLYARGEFEELDPAWNVFVGQDTSAAPRIIHWPGPRKPWNSRNVGFLAEWDAYDFLYDPMVKWVGRLFGKPPVNPVGRIPARLFSSESGESHRIAGERMM